MKKLLALLFMTTLLAGCSKEDDEPIGKENPENKKNNVEKAIDLIANKETAKDITISGEFADSDWVSLKEIRKHLPALENITLSDVTIIKGGIFSYQDDSYIWESNQWLKSFNAPNAKEINRRAFIFCEKLQTATLPNVTTIGEEAFRTCKSLSSISIPKAISIGSECFVACKFESIELPLIEILPNQLFMGCDSLKTIDLPKVNKINNDSFSRCENLTSIKLGCATEIETSDLSFESLDTKNINLDLTGIEATKVIGNIWKGCTWKNITDSGEPVKKPDFGIANFGTTMDFVSQHETKRTISGGNSKKLIYEANSSTWYIYNFDDNKKFTSGTYDYSVQFEANPSDWIFFPINSYITELNKLKDNFGEPDSASQDVFSFNMTDHTFEPSYGWYEAQLIMGTSSKTITYKFSNLTTTVESVLSRYTRSGKTKTWGFTIRTTYTQK